MGIERDKASYRPAGYAALIARYNLDVIPNWHESLVANHGLHRAGIREGVTEDIYPSRYWPGDTLGDHLEFALKYDGTNLAILSVLFETAEEQDILDYIQSKPTGKYSRRLWFLYEFLTGKVLPLDDLKQGGYISLLEPDKYYTVTPGRKVRRQRINDNLLGERRFCPTVRRTETLHDFEAKDLPARCRKVIGRYTPELLTRALGYLYTRETKSSFEIERITPSPTRTERFATLLRTAEREDFCAKSKLIEVQNRIVEARFRDPDYRTSQNYVGEAITLQRELIHFISPRPEHLPNLMDGLIATHNRMNTSEVPAVIQAAAITYGFVFLHPFEDGNGRIHRFLIHNILARRGFTPKGVMFPISATLLKNPMDYDASLATFSRKLMPLVEYSLDEDGHMTVHNNTTTWYRYIDMTPQAEALFEFIDKTINTELTSELAFLASHDQAKKTMQDIVDMPNRQIDLFIRFCLQNGGQLSATKRASHFKMLSNKEVSALEQIVQAAYGGDY